MAIEIISCVCFWCVCVSFERLNRRGGLGNWFFTCDISYTNEYATALLFIILRRFKLKHPYSTLQGASTFWILVHFLNFQCSPRGKNFFFMFVKRIKRIHWIIIFLFFTSQVNKANKKQWNVSNQGVVREELEIV